MDRCTGRHDIITEITVANGVKNHTINLSIVLMTMSKFYRDLHANCKTLTACARSHDEKLSVKILSKFVQKSGRSCVHEKSTYIQTDKGIDGDDSNIQILQQKD